MCGERAESVEGEDVGGQVDCKAEQDGGPVDRVEERKERVVGCLREEEKAAEVVVCKIKSARSRDNSMEQIAQSSPMVHGTKISKIFHANSPPICHGSLRLLLIAASS